MPFLVGGEGQRYLDIGGLDVSAGLLVGTGSLALLLLFLWRPWLPGAAVVAVGGVLVGLLVGDGDASLSLGPAPMAVAWPPLADFSTALVMLVIPQIPLTLTNSVVATVDTARTYFGPGAERVTPVRTSLSIAAGNLWAGLVGGLPMCHGSGGLTAHYRTGARTPVATTLIGLLLIAVAFVFGVSALEVRGLMPYAVLGALLAYVGAQHLLLGLKVSSLPHLAVVVLVGLVVLMPFGNMAVGAGAGLVAYWLARWVARLRAGPPR